MPELNAKFRADTKDFDVPVARMAKNHATAMADIRRTVDAERARNTTIIGERKKFAETSRRQYFDQIKEKNRIDAEQARRDSASTGFFGGKFSRLGVAQSMFTSVARDAAASLASGAPITQVIGQQAPQVLQALSMLGISLKALGLYAVGAGLAILTMKKAAEAYTAKQDADRSVGRLAETIGANRDRLHDLLTANKDRLKPGEAGNLSDQLWRATVATVKNPGDSFWAQNLKEVEEDVRGRLREVIITDADKKKLTEIKEISTKALIESMPEFDKARAAVKENFRVAYEKIMELGKVAKTPADYAIVNQAAMNLRAARDKELADIEENEAKKNAVKFRAQRTPDANELQRISGMAVGETVMVDLTRNIWNEIRGLRSDARQNGRGVSFGR